MDIYLIRHGQTQAAADKRTQSPESDLSEGGKEWIRKTKKFYDQIDFDQVFVSPLKRTQDTAKILFGDRTVSIKTLDYLYEYVRPARLYGVSIEEIEAFWEKHKDDKFDPKWKPEDGESLLEIWNRGKKLIKELEKLEQDAVVAIVGHGIFFRHLIGLWVMGEEYNPDVFFKLLRDFVIDNGAYIKLTNEDGKRKVKEWCNEVI